MELLRILLVDDEEDLVSAMAERLALRGFQVETATSGTAAIKHLTENDFRVLILDVKMPGIDGLMGLTIIFAGLIGGILWNLLTWLFGIPSSSSHALFGGLIGAGLAALGTAGINWTGVTEKVLIPAVAAPLIAGLVAACGTWLVYRITRSVLAKRRETGFRWGQIATASLVALAHGALQCPLRDRAVEQVGKHFAGPFQGQQLLLVQVDPNRRHPWPVLRWRLDPLWELASRLGSAARTALGLGLMLDNPCLHRRDVHNLPTLPTHRRRRLQAAAGHLRSYHESSIVGSEDRPRRAADAHSRGLE
jgi:hypothetical protein